MLNQNQVLQNGRYCIKKVIGPNGIGTDYEAYDDFLKTNVLLKEIEETGTKTASQNDDRHKIFANANNLTNIEHNSLIKVHQYFAEIDRHFMAVEFVAGYTLGDFIKRQRNPVSLEVVTDWADQLLDALQYLHKLDPPIFHGNVTPQNIKLSSDGKVKLLPLNTAHNLGSSPFEGMENQQFNAESLNFSPLEQIWQKLDPASQKVILNEFDEQSEKILMQPADARSDIYLLGATLYYLATRQLPMDAMTRIIDILEGKEDPLVPPHKLDPNVSPEISDVLMKSLQIKREHRFASASIMRQTLRTAILQVKEREAISLPVIAVEGDIVLEIPAAIDNASSKLPVTQQKNVEIAADVKQQIEIIKQQLREAEAKRLAAEKRAAEAEMRLLEKENFHVESNEPSTLLVEPEVSGVQVLSLSPEAKKITEKQDFSQDSDDAPEIFSTGLPKESNVFRHIALAGLILAIFGGAGWGVWNFVLSKSSGTEQLMMSGDVVPPVQAEHPAPVSKPEPASFSQSETPGTTPLTQVSPAVNEPELPKSSPAKTKALTAQPPTQPKKQPQPKAKENKKKSVTLDDLINDN